MKQTLMVGLLALLKYTSARELQDNEVFTTTSIEETYSDPAITKEDQAVWAEEYGFEAIAYYEEK